MSKTGAGLAAWAESIIAAKSHVYWYGTYCNPCSASLLSGKTRQYPSHYGDNRQSTYKKHIQQGKTCTDCVGLIKGYYWEKDGEIKYKRDGLPDKGANGMYSATKIKDTIDTLPEIPGLLVWTSGKGHIGVYVGGGYVVEARGFSYGVQRNKLSARAFKYWGVCPYIEYTAEEIALAQAAVNGTKTPTTAPATKPKEEPAEKPATPEKAENKAESVVYDMKTLRINSKGTQVKVLQWILNHTTDYTAGVIDGHFGTKTLAAVRQFQQANGLTVDGVVGKKTWTKLLG